MPEGWNEIPWAHFPGADLFINPVAITQNVGGNARSRAYAYIRANDLQIATKWCTQDKRFSLNTSADCFIHFLSWNKVTIYFRDADEALSASIYFS
jgi:hypothetical protein